MKTPEQSAFRIRPMGGRLLFQVLCPPEQIHTGVLGRGAQAVIHMTRDVLLNTLGTLLILGDLKELHRRDGFQGQESPPCVVPVKVGDDAPPDAVCRVIVEASHVEGHGNLGMLTVELTPERAACLAERLLRRGGLRRVHLIDGNRIAWEDAPPDEAELPDSEKLQ